MAKKTKDGYRKGREKRGSIRLWGAPPIEKFLETREGKALAKSARIHYTNKKDQEHLLAVEKLALDIFHDPMSARAFAVNPEEYMRRAGLNVKLDLNSQQVRLAMALGDPEVRNTARKGDVYGFLDALQAQGIKIEIDENVRQGRLSEAVAAFEVAAAISAVAVSYAAVAWHVAAVVQAAVETSLAFHHVVKVSTKIGIMLESILLDDHEKLISQLAEHYGGREFGAKIRSERMKHIIMKYVELEVKDIEEMENKAKREIEKSEAKSAGSPGKKK